MGPAGLVDPVAALAAEVVEVVEQILALAARLQAVVPLAARVGAAEWLRSKTEVAEAS